jgi:alpha-galactosidase
MSVARDRSRAVVGWYRILARPLPGPSHLRLRGLDPDARYAVSVWPEADDALVRANTLVRGGDELMAVGLLLDDHAWEAQARGDFEARLFVLEATPA